MGWHQFLEDNSDIPDVLYHLCRKCDWDDKKSVYYPTSYEKEKFTRATHRPDKLMEIANCFYNSTKNDNNNKEEEWICLQINTIGLKFQHIDIKLVTSDLDINLKCPHIYGGLPREVITKVYPVQRNNSDGTFLFIIGLTDVCTTK